VGVGVELEEGVVEDDDENTLSDTLCAMLEPIPNPKPDKIESFKLLNIEGVFDCIVGCFGGGGVGCNNGVLSLCLRGIYNIIINFYIIIYL
jgi:hypothetical protein